ncbi:MAG: hypothetical protein IT531_00210 [Burkholderiales bacterium]|nr:hypothetical protein [Burkholderiales bacterium]
MKNSERPDLKLVHSVAQPAIEAIDFRHAVIIDRSGGIPFSCAAKYFGAEFHWHLQDRFSQWLRKYGDGLDDALDRPSQPAA